MTLFSLPLAVFGRYFGASSAAAVCLLMSSLGMGALAEERRAEGIGDVRFAKLTVAPSVPRGADGHPDLNGVWKNQPGTKPIGNIGKDLPGFKLPLTPEGEAALKHNLTATIDPESLCLPGGIPRHSASALPFVIQQSPKNVAFLYFYNYFRLIPTDGAKHPDDPDPAFFGHEVGWWDGDSLVIDAIAFKGEQVWADENANPHSDALHVLERWTRLDETRLFHESIIEDPKFYTKPFKYTRTFVAGVPGEGLREYACNENNVGREGLGFGPGPIRPDGSRGYVDAAPLPPPPAPLPSKR